MGSQSGTGQGGEVMKRRDICKIIEAIKAELPVEHYSDLRASMDRIAKKAAYHSPEQQYWDWFDLENALFSELGHPNCEFKQRIADIMLDKIEVPGSVLPGMTDPIPSMNRIRCTKCGEEFALERYVSKPTIWVVNTIDGPEITIRCPKCGHEEEIM